MSEIFRFTQLREATGINIEEVRQKNIQFFNKIETVEKMQINTAFLESFENGIKAINKYIIENEGFLIRSKIPHSLIRGDYKKFNKTFFELSYLLSQYNSDKKENQNQELFSQILKQVEQIEKEKLKEFLTLFDVHFEDLLVLYFKSNAYPSYLRLLIRLRRWHYVLSTFTLTEIKNSFKKAPKLNDKIAENTVLHFLLNAKILLPKYLFNKIVKDTPNTNTDIGSPKKPDTIPKKINKTTNKKKTKIKDAPIKK